MKAQFTDSTKTSVYIDFNSTKSIVPYETVLEVRDALSFLINERQQMDDAAKAKIAALAKANAALAAKATISAPKVEAPKAPAKAEPKDDKK